MNSHLDRRTALLSVASVVAFPSSAFAQSAEIWSVTEAYEALQSDKICMIDVRSHEEWGETGVAEKAWAISMHEDRFVERLFAARSLAGDRLLALICATGGRSRSVMRSLRQSGYRGFVDVSEGMLGSSRGPGWIAAGLPIVTMQEAVAALPKSLV